MDFVVEIFERIVVFVKGNVLFDCDIRDVFFKGEIFKKVYFEEFNVIKLCRVLGYDEIFLIVKEFVEFRKNGYK